jgi:outer membrane protein assembly factor BamC
MLATVGCSTLGLESKKVDYKAAAVKPQPLEVPPDLTTPGAEDHYTIPDGGAVANYSDFAKGGVLSQARTSSVLPESRSVRLEHNGAQRWLVVNDKAENVWPVIKAFWQENGFVIKVDNPQAGIIETDWAENRSKIPMDGLRRILGKVLDGLYDSGERDMYHVRLERGKDGNSTEIYLTQYGKEEVLIGADKSTSKWQPRPNDPELEATMLQMLMAKLGGAEAQVQAKAQMEASSAPGVIAAPRLQTLSSGSKIILLSEPFDRSWRTVGLALEHQGFAVEDKDRVNGIYFVSVEEKAKEKGWLDKLAFWRSDEKAKPARYQVTVHEGNAGCEVAANNSKGESNSDTQRIIDALYQALGK